MLQLHTPERRFLQRFTIACARLSNRRCFRQRCRGRRPRRPVNCSHNLPSVCHPCGVSDMHLAVRDMLLRNVIWSCKQPRDMPRPFSRGVSVKIREKRGFLLLLGTIALRKTYILPRYPLMRPLLRRFFSCPDWETQLSGYRLRRRHRI